MMKNYLKNLIIAVIVSAVQAQIFYVTWKKMWED